MPSATGSLLKRKRIVVLGSRSVGKSSLILQQLENRFVENYYPTIESTFRGKVFHNGKDYDCEIVDTAGQDEFSLVNANHTIGTHGYILVYSVTSRNSLETVKSIHDRILNFAGVQRIPCVIVGSKSDLSQNSRQIESIEGQAFASSISAAWIESSAKKNINVGQAFQLCLAEIEKQSTQNSSFQPPQPTTNRSSCILM